MDDFAIPLLLELDVCSLTMSLVNIASASGGEGALADAIEAALRTVAHLDVDRIGDTVIARTDAGHDELVVVAGHLDTAPVEGEPLAYAELGDLFGPGAGDAKGALAMTLKAAVAGGYSRDVTFVFYAGGRDPDGGGSVDLPQADFVVLAEPTGCAVGGGALDHPWARSLIDLTGIAPTHGLGDAHGLEAFASLGIPAVAFGPGDPSLAGMPGEFVPTAQLARCEFVLRQWLTTAP